MDSITNSSLLLRIHQGKGLNTMRAESAGVIANRELMSLKVPKSSPVKGFLPLSSVLDRKVAQKESVSFCQKIQEEGKVNNTGPMMLLLY